MPPLALVLLIAAATLHTGWNLIVKHVDQKLIVTWWALLAGSLVFLPWLAASGPIPADIWPFVAASALAEIGYFVTLARAYDVADFSLAYPIARGTAPALLAVWALVFLGERPRPAGLAGVGVLLAGLFLVGGAGRWLKRPRGTGVGPVGVMAALVVAFWISVYSAIDAAAVRRMDPGAYNVLVLGLTALLSAPYLVARHGGPALIATWRAHRGRILAVGVLMFLAYLMVLTAYAMAPASYVAAIREVGIVLAALVGWRWLGEGFGPIRTVGAVLMLAGIAVIALAG